MNTLPDTELDLDKLFLPGWAKEGPSAKRYEHFQGERPREDRDGRDRRGPRRDFGGGQRPRSPQGDSRGPRRDGGGGRKPDFQGGRGKFGGPRRDNRFAPPPAPAPLVEVNLTLTPDDNGVDSLARQIKTTGRAYPLFDIARIILQKPERYTVTFSVKKNAEGKLVQPLFVCALDDTLWLSEDEVVAYALGKHFNTFYQAERTATEPPKGTYTFVGQCGLSGVVLGPPNYHDYQTRLHKLHAEKFSKMPFDQFKSRVKIVKDEAVVKKWIEDLSWKTEYVCMNLPEPLRLQSMDEVEKHFRQVHKETIIKPVESHTLNGLAARSLRSPQLVRLVRERWEEQRRFPLQIATVLSQQFASRGLQFFKVNKTVTHVSVARPSFLDLETTPVSESIRRIFQYINEHSKCSRRQLIESLAPSPQIIPVAPSGAGERQEASGDGQNPAAPIAPSPSPLATEEQTAIIADLHWLVHQGHVIEFANGTLDTAKKPLPKPPKPAKTGERQAASGDGQKPEAPVADSPSPIASTEPVAEATPIVTAAESETSMLSEAPGEEPVLSSPETSPTPAESASATTE